MAFVVSSRLWGLCTCAPGNEPSLCVRPFWWSPGQYCPLRMWCAGYALQPPWMLPHTAKSLTCGAVQIAATGVTSTVGG